MASKQEIVFTGPATTRAGVPILRADLIAHAEKAGYKVANRVSKKTKMLIASRVDTVKAAKARELGVFVLTYGAFLDQFGGDVPRSDRKANSWVDKGVQLANDAVEYL